MDRTSLTRSAWHAGSLLSFSALSGTTDYHESLVLRTTSSPVGLEIKFPEAGRLTFDAPPTGDVLLTSQFFNFGTSAGQTQGVLLDAFHLLLDGPCSFETSGTSFQKLCIGSRLLLGVKSRFNPELIDSDIQARIDSCNIWSAYEAVTHRPTFPAHARRTAFTALSIMWSQICSPQGEIRHRWSTPDRWPHKDMWLWDSAFHAIGWRHIDPALARDIIQAVFDTQRDDGFIALRMSPKGIAADVTQPPILAYAAFQVYLSEPASVWLKDVYPKLCRYVEWDLANRDQDGAGLVEWVITEHLNCRSGESGMDNSPRFDRATHVDAVDFNAFLALECETLAKISSLLGNKEGEAKWKNEHSRLCTLINERLWSSEKGFYGDYNLESGALSPVLSSAGFLPLVCGAASQEQAACLAAKLQDPEMFGTPFPVPAIPRIDTASYSKDMWRGPVWINMNWLIIQGLKRYGFLDLANHITQQTSGKSNANASTTVRFSSTMTTKTKSIHPSFSVRASAIPQRVLCSKSSMTSAGRQLSTWT